MKATVRHNDFEGTVAADISDRFGNIAHLAGGELEAIASHFQLDKKKFKLKGLKIEGSFFSLDEELNNFELVLICEDLESTTEPKAFEEITVPNILGIEIFKKLFKRISIVLHEKGEHI